MDNILVRKRFANSGGSSPVILGRMGGRGRSTARRAVLAVLPALCLLLPSPRLSGDDTSTQPSVPRIDKVEPLAQQPQENDPTAIWYDNFNTDKTYTETSGELDATENFGRIGSSLKCYYAKGSQGEGNRKVFFGDNPNGALTRNGEKFDEIYWRIYVKHQAGWTGGGPAKMSRATSIVASNWSQSMISHVWSSGESLTLDPASGVPAGGDRVITTTYNDFANLRWLGNNPVSEMKISSTAESGWWVCVEARAKLNTPGKKDGENQLWIDGRLECERHNLDWRGSYDKFGINAVFLEAYWNEGAPVEESRWYDNFVISTRPIGPVTTPRNPILYKTVYQGPDQQTAWECEIALDREGSRVVWRSGQISDPRTVTVNTTNGAFVGMLAGKTQLSDGTHYYARARQQSSGGVWSDWSRWHQEFLTEGIAGQSSSGCDVDRDGAVNIVDVIRLLLLQRDHPEDGRGDYDGDGHGSQNDAVALLSDMAEEKCGLSGALQLAAAGKSGYGIELREPLEPRDRQWLKGFLFELPFTPEQRNAFTLLLSSTGRLPASPETFSLAQNTPNPFNPQTAITYTLPDKSAQYHVSLKVYDLRNSLVKTLVDEFKPPGTFTVFWDGTDEKNNPASNGVYLYRLEAGEFAQTRKMVLLR